MFRLQTLTRVQNFRYLRLLADVPPVQPVQKQQQWTYEKVKTQIKRIATELFYGSKLLWNQTKQANAIKKMDKAGLPITRREFVFLRNNRLDLIRCIPILLIWRGIPFIHSLIIPFYIYYARHMLPKTYKFFDEKSDEVHDLKEDKYTDKLLAGIPAEPVPFGPTWKKNEIRLLDAEFGIVFLSFRSPFCPITRASDLRARYILDQLNRKQLAAVCYSLALHPTSFVPAWILRPRLRKHVQFLNKDDRLLRQEGIKNLSLVELREACQHRGVSIWGRGEDFLRTQLAVWLDLTEAHPDMAEMLLVFTHGYPGREMVLSEA